MSTRSWCWISAGTSVGLWLTLCVQWHFIHTTQLHKRVAISREMIADGAIRETVRSNLSRAGTEKFVPVPTGVYVQSMKFVNSSDVRLTGYVWQKYDERVPDESDQGFVLPEAIDWNGNRPELVHKQVNGNSVLKVWYFENVVRQKFDYARYPFDHKIVWIKIWPNGFDQSLVLFPDLESYDMELLEGLYGIEPSVVLDGWRIQETYFSYDKVHHGTSFGMESYPGPFDSIELSYNAVIHRDFLNAFVTNLVPLGICAAFVFAMLLTVTSKDRLASKFGFNTSTIVASSSALFFVIMVAHIQLRREFPGESIVYMEKFYFLMYFVLVGVVANTYLFSMNHPWKVIQFRDNLIPKLTYWPVILIAANLITFFTF